MCTPTSTIRVESGRGKPRSNAGPAQTGKRIDFGEWAYILRFMRRAFALTVLALLAGSCATDPYSKLETATPTLSPAQIAELQKTAKTPEELGIQMRVTERSAEFA